MSLFQLLNGLTFAALLFVVAGGFTLIFGLLRIVNLAHGALYLFGGYIGFTVGGEDRQLRARRRRRDGCRCRARLRARPGPAALRPRQRAAPGAADARRRVRAQRSRARDLGRRHVHRADPAGAAGRHERVRRVLSDVSPVRAGWSASSSSSRLWLLLNDAARRADPRRRRRCRDGGGHPASTSAGSFSPPSCSARRWRGLAALLGGAFLTLYPTADAEILVFSLAVVIIGGRGSLIGAAVGSLLVGLLNTFGQVCFPSSPIS